MKIKVKHVLLFIIVSIAIMSFTIYNIVINNDVYEEVDNRNIINNKLISLMIEETRGSGVYKVSKDNKWPSKKYIFNETLSNCKNGSTLTWNENDNSVTVNVNKTDKCDVYFDVEPGDINVSVNNLSNTYGKLGSINCSNSDATYNQKYNRIEVSNINTKYENCTLNYTDSTSKVNLADYIIGLAGTTQGTGQVVNEKANIPDWNSVVAIAQSAYKSQTFFTTTYFSGGATSGTTVSGVYTFANNTWTSVPSKMTSDTYYHFKFNPSESGYYQMCYNLSAGDFRNQLFAYVNTDEKKFESYSDLEASSSSLSGCIELGYVTSSDYIKIIQRVYTDISTLSFSIKKAATVNLTATGIRYEGKNPNNYIWFNNEYWRIIGVFDSASHGQSGKNLVKIIRSNILGGLAWNRSSTNDWTASSLKSLLNGAYYNAQNEQNYRYCYGSSSLTANCDYTKKGIQSGYRRMITNVTWYLGGYPNTGATADLFYGYERGTRVYSGRPTSTTGYIGLMYPSDYGYSVLSSSCARTTNLSDYDSITCAGASWLYGKGGEWTLTPSSSNSYTVFMWNSSGTMNININGQVFINANSGTGSRPVLYLDASVYKIDGDGSLNLPYIIGM